MQHAYRTYENENKEVDALDLLTKCLIFNALLDLMYRVGKVSFFFFFKKAVMGHEVGIACDRIYLQSILYGVIEDLKNK